MVERAPAPRPRAALAERVILGAVVCGYLALVLRAGWLCDDAFISFRSGDNWVHGHGLRYNPAERVQAFTAPLWTLLFTVLHLVVRDPYYLGLGLGVCLSAATVALVALRAPGPPWARSGAIAALGLSAAFVDYSTSGLENPLSHLLVAVVIIDTLSATPQRSPTPLLLAAGLTIVNRLDHALLVALPAAATILAGGRRRIGPRLAAFVAAPAAWLGFAIVYYGFALPNTAYAKLNVHIERGELLQRGGGYLAESLAHDPVTLLVPVAAVTIAVVSRSWRHVIPLGGVVAHLGYVAWIGGDFMAGRFLTAPLLVSAVVIVAQLGRGLVPGRLAATAGALLVLLAARSPASPLSDRDTRCIVPPSGVVDERGCYMEHTALIDNLGTGRYRTHPYFAKGLALRGAGRPVAFETSVGMVGYAAGPGIHIIDGYALTDPLLARIRFDPRGGAWRPGHFPRRPPAAYFDSVLHDDNRLRHPATRQLYDDLRRITRGPLFTTPRLRAILRRNLGL